MGRAAQADRAGKNQVGRNSRRWGAFVQQGVCVCGEVVQLPLVVADRVYLARERLRIPAT